MKMSLAALAVCTLSISAQDYPAGQLKHLAVPTLNSLRPLSVAAMEIEVGMPYPSIIYLKGSVEIKTPVCLVTNPVKSHEWACDGSLVLRADEAELHEDTGQIEARGNVKVTRERSREAGLGR